MTDPTPHPDSAYAALLSLREWCAVAFPVPDLLDEIDRRLATADRGVVKPELQYTGALRAFVDRYECDNVSESDRDCAIFVLCRDRLRALEGGQHG